jgi:peptidoglycan/xylan/chitin deacetylase (PgdA/CDA1 family)
MSFRSDLFSYLDHFERTVPVRDLADNPRSADLIGLRHDVDHSLDLALELAWIESERGLRATYYILNGHPYTNTDHFIEKCVQIQELGHEVGLHNDAITQWIHQSTPPEQSLKKFLGRLRKAGLDITGTATHGARECYQHGYLNSWCFAETRGDSTGRWNGEGLPSNDPSETVVAPANGEIELNGRRLPLWTLSMADLGLRYEAHRVAVDRYYTDSGGSWRRSPDPLTEDLSRGRIQILIHPEWWGGRRRVFFLSTARSGSKWLANLIDSSTSAMARHELSLNHRFEDGELREEKRTGEGFRSFITEDAAVRTRLAEISAWVDRLFDDYVEANVYLAHCADELRSAFPDATFIHLHRDGRDVVRSLMNRSWYDTPEDDRHPELDLEDWDSLTQLEKCCWYWALTNKALTEVASYEAVAGGEERELPMDRATTDPGALGTFLEGLDIRVTLPELFARQHAERINESYSSDVPSFDQWTEGDQQTYARICGEVHHRLGYPALPDSGQPAPPERQSGHEVVKTTLLEHDLRRDPAGHMAAYRAGRCELEPVPGEGIGIHVRGKARRPRAQHVRPRARRKPGRELASSSRVGPQARPLLDSREHPDAPSAGDPAQRHSASRARHLGPTEGKELVFRGPSPVLPL